VTSSRPTGRFLMRMPPELHERLRREASRRGMSLNSLCLSALRAGVQNRGTPTLEGEIWSTWVEKARASFGDSLLGVLLFGSVARGDESDESDVDLLIVLRDDTPITRAQYRRWDGTEPADDTVSPHLAHLPPPGGAAGSLWIEVALDGLILYDPSRALARSLSSLRRRLASGEVGSGTAHGQRYWIHQVREEHRAQ
jgi:uncharacterized protein